jgi:DNA-directed RNA polymerase subunit H (RpoH/RPB5)
MCVLEQMTTLCSARGYENIRPHQVRGFDTCIECTDRGELVWFIFKSGVCCKKNVDDAIKHVVDKGITRLMMGMHKISQNSKLVTPEIQVEYILWEHFFMDKRQFVYVPEYRRLQEGEITTIEINHKLQRHQLPSMQEDDAMAIYLGYKPGDVVEAVYADTILYRIVVCSK